MSNQFHENLADASLGGELISVKDALRLLTGGDDILDVVRAAFRVRSHYFAREVTVHILNNVQNGACPEDCSYCAQSSSSSAKIESYPMKTDQEILDEAQAAYKAGACRYCMVFSGTGPSQERIDHLCSLVRKIKELYKIEVCVSPGVISQPQARQLKEAGLDRLNHNLNTSPAHYGKICTTHSFEDRLATLRAAKSAGLAVCSGVIVGMGENREDLIDLAMKFRELSAESIPVNFLIPIPGIALKHAVGLTPEYCLRVLCLFRFINPSAEIRMAAGREIHLRSLEPLGLYPANSLFLQGYLNARGAEDTRTLQMIRDAGFSIRSEIPLGSLLKEPSVVDTNKLKGLNELRPFQY